MAPAIASIDPGPFCIDKVANVAIGSYGAGIPYHTIASSIDHCSYY